MTEAFNSATPFSSPRKAPGAPGGVLAKRLDPLSRGRSQAEETLLTDRPLQLSIFGFVIVAIVSFYGV
jgi:hypothetical protein